MARSLTDKRNIKLIVAYDGSAYHGFQRQANAITVQQILEDRLAPLFGHPLTIYGSARTDTGVHAYGQVINFRTTSSIPAARIAMATRGLLPPDIVVSKAEEAAADFHARASAKGKIYVYRIYSQPIADPFWRNYAWHVTASLDVAAMHEAVQVLVGEHDFSAFRAAGGATVSPVRTIFAAQVTRNQQMVELRIAGNGFLYHMVRNIMGTLVEIGVGKRSVCNMAGILAGKDRRQAGATAPPQGLYLQEVCY